MAVMHDAIENGIGERRIGEVLVPMLDAELAGDDGGLAGGAIIEHFEQIGARGLGDGSYGPVVDDEDVGPGQLCEPKLPSPWAMRKSSSRRGKRV